MLRRHETLARIAEDQFDVCIIGGGATGAGCALDAQLRGLKTVLLEAGDFASATSSASTKLAHGGVRYLQQAVLELDPHQYRVVKEALRERQLMLQNAPGLARPLQFLVPCRTPWDALYYIVGLKLYDWIAGSGSLAPSRYMPAGEACRRSEILKTEGLRCCVAYTDGQFDDARLNLALIKTFVDAGGIACNYARAAGFDKDSAGRIVRVRVNDMYREAALVVKARVFVNAAGPFADSVRQMANPVAQNKLRLSKGVHIILPLRPGPMLDAILVPKTEDGRVLFAIPWHNRVLVGTTDTEVSSAEKAEVAAEEADFLLEQLSRYTARPYSRREIVSAFAGVRPLLAQTGSHSTKNLARDHEVEIDKPSGLISALGGKWTTYRAMAESAIDAVQVRLGLSITASPTRDYPLHGAQHPGPAHSYKVHLDAGIGPEAVGHLVVRYAEHADAVAAIADADRSLRGPLVAGLPPIRAAVVYAVQHEMALTLEDVLARRIGLQFYSWNAAIAAAEPTGELMAPLLGWSDEETREAVAAYVARIEQAMRRIGLEPGVSIA